MSKAHLTSSQIPDHYQTALFAVALRREARLSGMEAARYGARYDEAVRSGKLLHQCRTRQGLDRTAAAANLPGWSRASLTLFEQGLLLVSELSAEMVESLRHALAEG